ncbi:MAG: PQQ-binding-like beta-propeller repeat protein, partial [Candidatus Saccharimonadales bacterium]
SGGGGGYVAAVRPPASNSDAPKLVYTIKESAPYCPTPVAFGDLLFLWSDSGIVSSVDIKSGKPLGRLRVSGNFFGSPVCVGGRLYCISEDGDVVVVSATRNPKLLARNPLGEEGRGTPAVAGGRMYLRTFSHLISIGGKR